MSVELKENIAELVGDICRKARAASRKVSVCPPAVKNAAILAMADAFERESDRIEKVNALDLEAGRTKGLSGAMIDRLRLDKKGIGKVAKALREIAALPDPVGEIENVRVRPNGLRIGHMRSPIGVIGIIYESRPNVTADAGALCLKSGNAVILRGGSEAIHSNRILAEIMNREATAAGVPENAIQLIPTTDRAAVGELLRAKQFVDIIIPRGGKPLIERISKESEIPVIKHLDGNCSVYIDEFADPAVALPIVVNSKTHRTGVCNAAETLLVHQAVAATMLPALANALVEKGVELRGCERTRQLVPEALPATEEDWYAEYLDLIMAVKVVDSFDDAIDFINHYGSHHTETIVTRDYNRAMTFMRAVDSACVHVNASTRFSDGGEYGLGAEIGISTDKLHARGPMGLRELTNAKWIVLGEGQVRA